ncbi:DEK protein [Oesophagostomum dentatum]|uniref:protein-serine/threonine phosphatase n=1 Tax=Oesophagostomum dentatum TaxID=61180 RepID=A0A0B1T961_OESDE|nr:DEK protein [Oesophagostomum dentatum]
MSLVQVQRSPSPSVGDESEVLVSDHARYLAVVSTHDADKLTLLIGMDYYKSNMTKQAYRLGLRTNLGISSDSSPTCSHGSANGAEIESHLQLMLRILRPQDKMSMAVRLQTQVSDHARYLAVVSTHDADKLTLLIGMDYYKSNMTIGVVLPLLWCSRVELAGDGGVAVYGSGSCSKADNALLFRPVSVQAMWQQSPLELDEEDELKADTVRDYLSEEGKAKEALLRRELRQIMQSVDLDSVTSRDIREALAQRVGCVDGHKDFIDREMLVILGQMDKPSRIFPYLLLGTEWNASNWEELNKNNVGYILNMTREVDNFFPMHFKYVKISVPDDASTNLLNNWNLTYNFIKEAK